MQKFFQPDAEWQTLVEMLRWRVAHQPSQIPFTFLDESGARSEDLTYAQLDRRARAIAAHLQARELSGERALLFYQPGLSFICAFFGCLYAGVTAVPVYPAFHRKRGNPRLAAIAKDAQVSMVLSDVAKPDGIDDMVPALSGIEWLVPAPDQTGAEDWQAPVINNDSLAYLQYTSGSTASPKGVMVSHANLLHNLNAITQVFGLAKEDRGVFWLPPYHDMGLIGGIFEMVYGNSHTPTTLMSPYTFLQNPIRWLQAISDMQATTSGGPNFAYDYCVDRISPEQCVGLDLSRWRIAFNGAEVIRPETLDRFAKAFAPYGFRREAFCPCYGLAEATLMVSGGNNATGPIIIPSPGNMGNRQNGSEGNLDLQVGCGHSEASHEIMIVDPKTHVGKGSGEVGEIWVSGPSVAQGYWNRVEETTAVFKAQLSQNDNNSTYLRTGDLGFMQDGELFVTGRLKDLIIIRGRNYYPQDIEHTVEKSHSALQPYSGAAFSMVVEGQERLAIVYELKRDQRHVDVDEVVVAMRTAVSQDHELDTYRITLIRPGTLPKTSSGKIQRNQCRQMLMAEEFSIIGERIQLRPSHNKNEVQISGEQQAENLSITEFDQIAALSKKKIAELLNLSPDDIDLEKPIESLGISSLDMVLLKDEFETSFNVELPIELFFEVDNLDQLIRHVIGESQNQRTGE